MTGGELREEFSDATWEELRRRWRQGAYRAGFFRDVILADARRFGPSPRLLDIGCGSGLDGDPAIQQALAGAAGRYVGVEPDASVPIPPCVAEAHRCCLEDAPLLPSSIDVAFASFVLEHLRRPHAFWAKLWEILSPGGVFWGFTIDWRHFFGPVSLLAERSGLKSWYLRRVRSGGTLASVVTYPTYYRANTPRAIRRHAGRYASVRFMNLHQTGQFDAYLPRWLHPASHLVDRLTAGLRLPGPTLVMRLEK